MSLYKLGLIVNPMAGIGGRVGLKGSDGAEIRNQALERGAEPLANERTAQMLAELKPLANQIQVYTVAGTMGETVSREAGFSVTVIDQPAQAETEASDTRHAVKAMLDAGVDILVFAGGDGTARDVCAALEAEDAVHRIAVVGVPAGCKIHSPVYAISPKHAGELLSGLIEGKAALLAETDVMDIDEAAFRQGVVKARRFGELWVPQDRSHMQALKEGGIEQEAIVLQDIAQSIVDEMEPDVLYFIGSGSTPAAIMELLDLDNTLLGVDLVMNNGLLASDLTEKEILDWLDREQKPAKIIITVIGGQGVVLGRGNQQLSPEVVRRVGIHNIQLIATAEKIRRLQGQPLRVDSGDEKLNEQLSGSVKVLTGYNDYLLYRIAH